MTIHIKRYTKCIWALAGGIACIFAPVLVKAQVPTEQWQKVLGGSLGDTLTAIEPTDADNGYIAGGYSYSPQSGDKKDDSKGGADYWILKLDDKGNPDWQLTLGGSGNDFLQSIKPVKGGDDGYIVGGYSYSPVSGDKTEGNRGGADYWILKLDAKGDIEWQRTVGGSADDHLSVIYPDPDGNGYIAGGWSQSGISGEKSQAVKGGTDFWVVKLSSDGTTIEWDRTFGGNAGSGFLKDIAFFKGDYILGGYSNADAGHDKTAASLGGFDYWVINIDGTGAKQWDATIGGSEDDLLSNIVTDENVGGYLLAGSSASDKSGDRTEGTRGGLDYWIVRIKDDGGFASDMAFGSSADDHLTSAHAVAGGKEGYIFGGWSAGEKSGEKSEDARGANQDYWIVKMDDSDKFAWDITVGGKSEDDNLAAIVPTPDGGYIAGGTSASDKDGDKTEGTQGGADYWLIKYQGCIPVSSTVNATFCAGANYRLPDNRTVSSAGTYTSLITGPTGCLDTVFTVLAELPRYSINISDTICQGSRYTLADGRAVSIGGIYAVGFRSVDGCDSMYTISLTVTPPDTVHVTAGICNGAAYLLPGGRRVYTSGVYTDLVSAAAGCDTVVVTTLDVAIIDVGVTQSGSTLSANITDLDTYQWINCATMQPVDGATGSSFTPEERGFYAVAVTLNNCPDTSACFPIGMEGMSIDELAGPGSVRLYPNPARDILFIESTGGSVIHNIALYSMLGATVYQSQPNTAQHTITTSELPSGVYMIRVQTAVGTTIERIEIVR